jgi:hypothetical protein
MMVFSQEDLRPLTTVIRVVLFNHKKGFPYVKYPSKRAGSGDQLTRLLVFGPIELGGGAYQNATLQAL